MDHVSTFLDLYEIVFRKMEGNRKTIYIVTQTKLKLLFELNIT